MFFEYGLGSHIGRCKPSNQDKILIKIGEVTSGDFGLFAVADGLGGLAEGDNASSLAIEALKDWWNRLTPECLKKFEFHGFSEDLQHLFAQVNERLTIYGRSKRIKTGTTLSVIFVADGRYSICHVGDSRIYQINVIKGTIRRLTQDHTYVAEKLQNGHISEDISRRHPKKNILTQCLGVSGEIEVYLEDGSVTEHDVYVLCSDGLYQQVAEETILTCILEGLIGKRTYREMTTRLIHQANASGGKDNISLIIFGFKPKKGILKRLWADYF